MKRLVLSTVLLLAVTITCIVIGCRKTSEEMDQEAQATAVELNSAATPLSTTSDGTVWTCVCDRKVNPACQSCVTSDLMGGALSRTFSATWDNCDNGCSNASVQTAIKFCYDPNAPTGTCGLLVEFYPLPPCLAGCSLKGATCIKGNVSCSGNGSDIVVSGSYIGADGHLHDYSLTFAEDPKIKLCCGGVCCTAETL
jgi:hypothetical protein